MSRSRKIEPEAAIQAAQSLFWKHGYCGLGTRQIEEETGLTRFTLQTSYGGKKSLFLQTLDSYLDHFETGFLPRVRSHDLEPLASWFEARANPALMREVGCYGCLMLNSTIEFQGQDADINLRTDRYFKSLRKSFRAALLNARKHGALGKDVDVSANVEILLGLALGLNVVIRAAANNAAGRRLAASTANMIRKWR